MNDRQIEIPFLKIYWRKKAKQQVKIWRIKINEQQNNKENSRKYGDK